MIKVIKYFAGSAKSGNAAGGVVFVPGEETNVRIAQLLGHHTMLRAGEGWVRAPGDAWLRCPDFCRSVRRTTQALVERGWPATITMHYTPDYIAMVAGESELRAYGAKTTSEALAGALFFVLEHKSVMT